MTKKALVALKKSAKHWASNVETLKKWNKKGYKIFDTKFHLWVIASKSRRDSDNVDKEAEEVSFGDESCALCRVFYKNCSCGKCILFLVGQDCNNPSSLWQFCRLAKGNNNIIKAAENMSAFLEKLVSEEEL